MQYRNKSAEFYTSTIYFMKLVFVSMLFILHLTWAASSSSQINDYSDLDKKVCSDGNQTSYPKLVMIDPATYNDERNSGTIIVTCILWQWKYFHPSTVRSPSLYYMFFTDITVKQALMDFIQLLISVR